MYSYDTRNELYSSGPGSLYYHAPSGLLAQIIASDGTVQGLDYVGDELVAEIDGQGQVSRRYVYGPGTDEPVVWYEGSGTGDRRYLHADERGSVIAVSDTNGNKLAINSYDEFGISGAGNVGRFQYTGQKWIPELGMYDYKARMYSPSLGRFLQTDPIGYGDGLNWYNYAHGDAVNGTDPSGSHFCDNRIDNESKDMCYSTYDSTGRLLNDPADTVYVICDATCAANRVEFAALTQPTTTSQLALPSLTTPFFGGASSYAPQRVSAPSRFSCLKNIDSGTLINLGLDAVGAVTAWTGLKGAWEVGSAAVGVGAGLLAVTSASLTGDNKDQVVAGSGAVVGFASVVAPHFLEESLSKKVVLVSRSWAASQRQASWFMTVMRLSRKLDAYNE